MNGIPFFITRAMAEIKIRQELKKNIFIPRKLVLGEMYKLREVYIPVWLHNVQYREKANIMGKRRVGWDGFRQEPIWYTVKRFRDGMAVYNNVMTVASEKINRHLVKGLLPYDLNDIKPLEPEDLAEAFTYERELEEEGAREKVLEIVKDLIEKAFLSSIKLCRYKTIKERNARYKILNDDCVLFPAWSLTIDYKGKTYTILINGQTGKVSGKFPMNRVVAEIASLAEIYKEDNRGINLDNQNIKYFKQMMIFQSTEFEEEEKL